MYWFLSLLVALQPLPPYPGDEPGNWTCVKHIHGVGGSMWVRRVLDPEGDIVLEEVAWSGQDRLPVKMQWRLGPGTTRVDQEFSAFVTWSRAPRRPVRLVIAADGRVEERPLIRSGDLAMFRRDGAIPVQVWYSVDLPEDGPVPSLYGVRRLTLTAVEDGCARIGSAKVSLPDWEWLEREVESARLQLAAQAPQSSPDCRLPEPPMEEPDGPMAD